MPRTFKKNRFVTLAAVGVALLAPADALANTVTVDDDRAQCPIADYTSLPAAVAAVAQGDTIYVCPGTYPVPGGAGSGGLKIEKNLSLVGAGADQVFVQPDGTAPSMATATPNPRDESGNVITVHRRSIELFHVNISGLTVRANGTAVEGGIAMGDVTEGSIKGVRVEGLVPATGAGTGLYSTAPLSTTGTGIILSNTIEGKQNEVTIEGSEVSGFNNAGVLIDNRLLNGVGDVGNNSRMLPHIKDTEIIGGGLDSSIEQDGIEVWGSGSSLDLKDSVVSGTGDFDASTAAIMFRGALIPPSIVSGSSDDANDLSGNGFGIASKSLDGLTLPATTLNATRNWFGPLGPGLGAYVATSNVNWHPAATSKPAAPDMTAVVDGDPEIDWDTKPHSGDVFEVGDSADLAVTAGDDFGVHDVEFFADGVSLGVSPTPPLNGDRVYTGTWTVPASANGSFVELTAVATDSIGQTVTTSTVTAEVADTDPPEMAIDSGPADGSTIGTASATFTFSADEPSTFECSYDSAPLGACSGTGSDTATGLSEGVHHFLVQATDTAGNVSSPVTVTFTVDTIIEDVTPPETVILSSPPAVIKKVKATFAFDAPGETGETFACSVDDAAFTPCTSPITINGLERRKKHQFEVKATDSAGNTDPTPASYVVKVLGKKSKKK
ncbi:MAG: large repetitive protein [Thermoleophilaceae bacterium]|jgi:hypothetical protein|nr:large repetitive protein [Thermoleophilaceae bacterium]